MSYRTVMHEDGTLEKVQNGANPPVIDTETIPPATLAALEGMGREELIGLIRRVSGAMWGIGIMTQAEREDAMLLKLSVLALTSDMAKEVVPAVREYFDRVRGKPAQTIVQANMTLVLEQQSAIRELRELDTETLLQMKRLVEGGTVIENNPEY